MHRQDMVPRRATTARRESPPNSTHRGADLERHPRRTGQRRANPRLRPADGVLDLALTANAFQNRRILVQRFSSIGSLVLAARVAVSALPCLIAATVGRLR
jgi:hypothetical protein